jgi:hypothetical protein
MTDAVLSNLITAASGMLGAIVGGSFTVWGAIKAVKMTSQDLESAEIRRQKVECLVSLTGLRFVIGNNSSALDEYKSRFMYQINKIPSLWADDSEVMKNLRDFHAENNNDRFILLLKNLGRTTKVATDRLSDADLKTVSLLPLNGR